MDDRGGIFAGDDPIALARGWLSLAEGSEPNDPNAIALATVDEAGAPDVRMVLLKEVEPEGFVFYTNYRSPKARQALGAGRAAFVLHWKSLRRQVRVRGTTSRVEGPQADAYFASRHPESRLGAWASRQSEAIPSREALLDEVARVGAEVGREPPRPPFWGGIRVTPLSVEFWADGAHRLHDRFLWTRPGPDGAWTVRRVSP